jgi:hypothetical protein
MSLCVVAAAGTSFDSSGVKRIYRSTVVNRENEGFTGGTQIQLQLLKSDQQL